MIDQVLAQFFLEEIYIGTCTILSLIFNIHVTAREVNYRVSNNWDGCQRICTETFAASGGYHYFHIYVHIRREL